MKFKKGDIVFTDKNVGIVTSVFEDSRTLDISVLYKNIYTVVRFEDVMKIFREVE